MKKYTKLVVIGIMMITLVLSYYYYLSRVKARDYSKKTEKIGEYEKIMAINLDKNYPYTPRSVVKLYNRIVKEFYIKKHSDKEIENLSDKARGLFDASLLKENERDVYINNLKKDIKDYNNREKKIIRVKVQSSNDIRYEKIKGRDISYVEAYYFFKEGKDYGRVYQLFLLRKDKNGNWKILTWKVVKGDKDLFN